MFLIKKLKRTIWRSEKEEPPSANVMEISISEIKKSPIIQNSGQIRSTMQENKVIVVHESKALDNEEEFLVNKYYPFLDKKLKEYNIVIY